MASAQAEITGAPAACIATLGPGAASLVNGVANALLDRVPLIVLTDCVPDEARSLMEHQNLAHERLFNPVVKCTLRATAGNVARVMTEAIAIATAGQPGPVHVDVPPDVTGVAVTDSSVANPASDPAAQQASFSATAELVRSRHPCFWSDSVREHRRLRRPCVRSPRRIRYRRSSRTRLKASCRIPARGGPAC